MTKELTCKIGHLLFLVKLESILTPTSPLIFILIKIDYFLDYFKIFFIKINHQNYDNC